MNSHFRIAIDGPSAAGKSTIAKKIAEKYNFLYIDTGAMYRCVGYYMLEHGIDMNDEKAVNSNLSKINIQLADQKILLNGIDIADKIRINEVSFAASKVSSYQSVREYLVKQQQLMAKHGSVVLDGRDIGTVVIPDAELKIYQVASLKERALRRYKENVSNGTTTSLEEIEKQIKKRDYDDSHRIHSPLKKAEDAIELDTSIMSIDEVVETISRLIEEKKQELK